MKTELYNKILLNLFLSIIGYTREYLNSHFSMIFTRIFRASNFRFGHKCEGKKGKSIIPLQEES